MPEQEEEASRKGAKLSKGDAFAEGVFRTLSPMLVPQAAADSIPGPIEATQAIGKGLGRVFNPLTTEQEIDNAAAEARGSVDYMEQYQLWMKRFAHEYSPNEYGEIEDFLNAKERVLRDLPWSEGQSLSDLTDELAYNEAGEAYLQREAQRTRRAGAGAAPTMGSAVRDSLRLRRSLGTPPEADRETELSRWK